MRRNYFKKKYRILNYEDEKLYADLFEYYAFGPDPDVYMPYGTMKARDGDPVVWITERLDGLGLFNKEITKHYG